MKPIKRTCLPVNATSLNEGFNSPVPVSKNSLNDKSITEEVDVTGMVRRDSGLFAAC